jgi:hypothetical protein
VRAVFEKASFSIRDNFEFGSNGIDSGDLRLKSTIHRPHQQMTEDGSLKSRDSQFSIRDNFESESKVIDLSDLHLAKHRSQITSTAFFTKIQNHTQNIESTLLSEIVRGNFPFQRWRRK